MPGIVRVPAEKYRSTLKRLFLHSINWRLCAASLLQALRFASISDEVDSRADNTLSLVRVLCKTQNREHERSTRQS